ncbi:gas vesicle protein K [Hyalangium gracile]|uniref:gas vesicle protein K n=1 Tax=Hyalangium gracile TaxID=394092 RepID=UPI001CCB3F08|nr:gas vesicle protein K [Hyalangium gracile]
MNYGEIRGSAEELEAFAESAEPPQARLPSRINVTPDKIERGLTQLVLSLVEFVRRLMEKQALRRIEGGSLSEAQVERLGTTLMRLEEHMQQLMKHFGVESLNLDLGPLGNLFDESAPRGEV